MFSENKYTGEKNEVKEKHMVQLTDSMLYDRLYTLSAEYSVSEEFLVNVAVSRLIGDVDFVRSLRSGKAELK